MVKQFKVKGGDGKVSYFFLKSQQKIKKRLSWIFHILLIKK
jgi:hypothetical protein